MIQIIEGRCEEVLGTFPDDVFDSLVTDPPYGIGAWDWIDDAKGEATPQAQQAWHTVWGREAYRTLKPGAHALVFGGSRTQHRIACGLEDAGFVVRDSLFWLYGTGRPKAAPQPPPFEDWVSQLKPAYEPIIVCWKPPVGTIKANFAKYGTGAFNVGGCRTGTSYPTNVLADEAAAVDLLEGEFRWFNCPKPTRFERDAGVDEVRGQGAAIGKNSDGLNQHPTVKPITLMRWLTRLVTPPGGTVLDPFAGSGSTGCGAALEAFDFTGIEMDAGHCEISRLRIEYWKRVFLAEVTGGVGAAA
jgi:DNA modification methylase